MPRFPTLPLVPTERAAWLIAGLAPIAVVIAAFSPSLWFIAPIAALALVVLTILDGLIAGTCEQWHVIVPADTEVGQEVWFWCITRSDRIHSKAKVHLDNCPFQHFQPGYGSHDGMQC